MTASILQTTHSAGSGGVPGTAHFGSAPTTGHLLLAFESSRDDVDGGLDIEGWTALSSAVSATGDGGRWWYLAATGGNSFSTGNNSQETFYETDIDAASFDPSGVTLYLTTAAGPSTSLSLGAVTAPAAGQLILYGATYDTAFDGTVLATPGSGWVTDWNANKDGLTSGSSDRHPHHLTMHWNGSTTPLTGLATIGSAEPYCGVMLQIDWPPLVLPSCGVSPMLFDVYVDNADGTLTYLNTLCQAKDKQIRVELDGTGSGEFTINRGSVEATAAILGTGADITRLVKVRIPDVSASAVFAFWIENGDFSLLSSQEAGDENLKFSGRGALAYLDRGIMADHSFLTDPFTGSDPFDNEWRGFAAGSGSKPGQILWRVIRELQEASRVIGATASHPIPALVMDFAPAPGNYPLLDSNGAAWTTSATTGDFVEMVGERVLSVVGRLIATGALTVQCSPDLVLSGYNTFGTTRTNGSFAAGKVRFVEAVNIRDSLARQIRGGRQATHELVAGSGADVYGHAQLNASTKPHWEAFQSSNSASVTALDGIGLTDLTQRLLRSESLQVPVLCGDDELNGLYLPGPSGTNGHYWVGDTISLHTGTGDFDVTNVAVRMAAITISEPDYAAAVTDLSIVTELNSTNIIASPITGGDYGGGGITSSTGGGGSSGSSGVTVKDEGVALATAAATLDFVGAGVVASGTGSTKTITISGSPNAELNIEGGQDVIKVHGSMGSTETFDPTDGNVHTGTLNANCTFTLNAPVGTGACTLELWLTQDGTGGRTITWPGSVTVQGTLDTTLSTTSRVVLETIDGGTTWIANVVGSGGVTSVALTVPAEFSVSGSPITSSGTLAITKATEAANTAWMGPTSGAAAQPTFRALVAADIPAGVGVTDHQHIGAVTFSGDGATVAFELPAAPFDAYSVLASVAGVIQDVTLSGAMLTTMTFASAPASGTDNVRVDIVAAAV